MKFVVNFIDLTVESHRPFTEYIYDNAKMENDISCKYVQYIDSEDSTSWEKLFYTDSNYSVVFVSSKLKDKFHKFELKLSDILTYRPQWRSRVKFVILWDSLNPLDSKCDHHLCIEHTNERAVWNGYNSKIKDVWTTYKTNCEHTKESQCSPQEQAGSTGSKVINFFQNLRSNSSKSSNQVNDSTTSNVTQSRQKPILQPKHNISLTGPSGLRNTGSICYMNSMIQALSASKKFIEQLTHLQSNFPNEKLEIFITILKDINKKSDVAQNSDSLEKLRKIVEWNRAFQQDAFQLLSFFINAIENDMGIPKDQSMPPKFTLLHTFTEDKKFNKVQPHLGLALPLFGPFTSLPGSPLTDLLDAFFQPSVIEHGIGETQIYLFDEPPEVLIVHIQGNEWNNDLGEYCKRDYHIQYEETLNYKFKIQKVKDESKSKLCDVLYDLVAVVQHQGTVNGGHYTTFRKWDHNWYEMNDDWVKKIDFRCNVVPYIMVYERSGGRTSPRNTEV